MIGRTRISVETADFVIIAVFAVTVFFAYMMVRNRSTIAQLNPPQNVSDLQLQVSSAKRLI